MAVVPVPVIDINVDETVYVPVGVAVTVPETACVPEFATV